MITIGQIAEMAGVSKSTVSRVLNSSGYVSQETREKIEAIIRKYHYSPSAAARSLSLQESGTVAVVVPELDTNNTFYLEVLSGATEVVDENGLTMFLCNTGNNADKEREVLLSMEQQRVKGVIFASAVGYASEAEARSVRMLLKNLNVPVVMVDRVVEGTALDAVLYENYESGYLAARRLIERGCRKIGIITGDMELKHARERCRGYVQALEESGLTVERKYIYKGNFTEEKACQIARGIIRSGDWPDGLVLSNNATTLGFFKAMAESGLKRDEDIRMVGIDHIPIFDLVGVKYDCVTRDMREMGRMAMRLLLERLEHPERKPQICRIPCITRFRMED